LNGVAHCLVKLATKSVIDNILKDEMLNYIYDIYYSNGVNCSSLSFFNEEVTFLKEKKKKKKREDY
jgi:hypothetical protein